MSFESDFHNIFDPCFTSEEDRDSVDLLEDDVESDCSEQYYDSEDENASEVIDDEDSQVKSK